MTDLQNDTRMSDFMSDVRSFGRDSAEGGDALPKLALRVAKAASDSVLDLENKTFGPAKDQDVFSHIYGEYVQAESKKAIYNHTANGVKTQVSKLRKIGQAAANPKYDFMDVLSRTTKQHATMKAAEQRIHAVYPSIVDVSRTQITEDAALTDEQISDCIRKPAAKEKTLQTALEAIQKKLDNLITGEGGITCQSENITKAFECVSSELATLARPARLEALLEEAAELGQTIELVDVEEAA